MKTVLERSAQQLLDKINALVPEEDLQHLQNKLDERYSLRISIYADDTDISSALPKQLQGEHGAAYARFLFNPTMLDVLVRNLKLPIHPIKRVQHLNHLDSLIIAWDSILAYLKDNPGFFTYRFGIEQGLAVEQALRELRQLALWVQEKGYSLTLKPIYTYRNANTGAVVTEKGGCFPPSMRSGGEKISPR